MGWGSVRLLDFRGRPLVQLGINSFRETPADAFALGDVFGGSVFELPHAAEVRQKLRAALGSDPFKVLEARGVAGFRALGAHPRDREAVRLVADFGDEHEGLRH